MLRKKRVATRRPTHYRHKKKEELDKNWFEKHGTTSDWVNVVVGIIVGAFTVSLFFQTQKSTKAAIHAVEETRKAVSESKRANEIAQKNYELAQTAIKKQEETFNVENTPFLRIDIGKMNPLTEGQPVKFAIIIKNIGKYPACVILYESSIIYSKTLNKTKPFQAKSTMVYDLVENHPSELELEGKPLPNSQIDSLKIGKHFVYYYGRITYINEANEKKRRYEYAVRLHPDSNSLEWIYNRNYDIK